MQRRILIIILFYLQGKHVTGQHFNRKNAAVFFNIHLINGDIVAEMIDAAPNSSLIIIAEIDGQNAIGFSSPGKISSLFSGSICFRGVNRHIFAHYQFLITLTAKITLRKNGRCNGQQHCQHNQQAHDLLHRFSSFSLELQGVPRLVRFTGRRPLFHSNTTFL